MKKLLIILFIFTIFIVKADTPFEQGYRAGWKSGYLLNCSNCKSIIIPNIPLVYDKALYSSYNIGYRIGFYNGINYTKN